MMSEDGPVKFAWLQKDERVICRTNYTKFPFKVSDCWEIHAFKPSSNYRELNLPQFQLFPAPASSYEKAEWANFMNYLSNRKKVAIVEMKSCSFYLFAPDECQKFTHINVLYKIEKELCVEEMSGENYNKAKNSSDDSKMSFNEAERDIATDDGSPVSLRKENLKSFNNGDIATDDGSPVSLRMESLKSFNKVRRDFATDDRSQVSLRKESGPERNARIHPSYLKTLSQTHVWPFGALAELIDNSRDACAPRLAISIEHLYLRKVGEKVPVLSIVDDGIGMSHNDIVRMLAFGHKADNENPDRIGCFGVGFKTGTMRLGKDVLVLTQTTGSRSVALLSQSYNENKENVEIPIITYHKIGSFMEIDLNIHSEEYATANLDAIKEFSPFNEYLLGERLGLFGEMGTGTQIYVWNLEKWGSNYSLEWEDGKNIVDSSLDNDHGDIMIRSRKIRSRAGQISQKVPLDYSLQAYLEVIFQDPRMKVLVQGSTVKSRPLAKSLNRTCTVKGTIMGKEILLTLGRSRLEWERMNGGIFLYWRGRLIEAYKRVGGMIHNADIGRGVIGVVDVTDLMHDGNGHVFVLNNKQGFEDCEIYAKLEEWLGNKLDKYWDKYFDRVDLDTGIKVDKPDHEWVQCDKCRKWRILDASFSSDCLPPEWFCYMPPFNGSCETPEQDLAPGIITVGTKRSIRKMQVDQTKENSTPVPAKKINGEQGRLVKVEQTPSKASVITAIRKGTVNNTSSRSTLVRRRAIIEDSDMDTSD